MEFDNGNVSIYTVESIWKRFQIYENSADDFLCEHQQLEMLPKEQG